MSELLRHVRRLAGSARRVTSVCSGAFLLAAAGLLDGRRATTHWAECDLLERGYPNVTVAPDDIYVHDGNVWTSAGVTAGIDLALALVADDHGRQAAATVARQLVVYLRRSGGQAQFSALLAAQSADSEPVRDLLSWLPDHLTEDLSITALAGQVNLSRAAVQPGVQGRGRDHPRRSRRGGPARGRVPAPRDHPRVDRARGPDLRFRHPRDHEPQLPPPAQHDARRPPAPFRRRRLS